MKPYWKSDRVDLYLGDCLEVMPQLPDNSVNLILTDPPYFNVKDEEWDRQWKDANSFLSWLDAITCEWQRILKPNGSLYCFASPRMAARVEVKLGDRFNVLNHLIWNKDGRSRAAQTDKDISRIFFPESERIIFAEHYGADNIAKGVAGYEAKCSELRGFVFEPIQKYLESERIKGQITYKQINAAIGKPVNGGGMATHYFSHPSRVDKCTWQLPTFDLYKKLQLAFPGYFTRSYESLRAEYESLRAEYESLRRPFNVSAEVPYTDVWTFPTVGAYPGKHPCEKPIALLEHIINASSTPDALILDCFSGSGTTAIAAKNLGRRAIAIEKEQHWLDVTRQRLGDFTATVKHLRSVQEKRSVKAVNAKVVQPSLFEIGA